MSIASSKKILNLKKNYETNDFWVQLLASIVGMIVVDVCSLDGNIKIDRSAIHEHFNEEINYEIMV